MDKQSRDAREMAKKLSFDKRVEYIWQYYKWHIIIAVLVIIAIVSTVVIIATRESYDLEVSYYGVNMFSDEQITALEDYMSDYVDDIDGDGEKRVKIHSAISDMQGGSIKHMTMLSQKLVAELTACVYPAYIFDEDFYNKMGPNADGSVMEFAMDLRENAEIREILGLRDRPVYWCTRMLYDRECDKEENVAANKNARLVEMGIDTK